jgi:hypothetical protein
MRPILKEVGIAGYYISGIPRQLLSLPQLQSLRLVNVTNEPWDMGSELNPLVGMSTLKKVRLISKCMDWNQDQGWVPETHRRLKEAAADRFEKSCRGLTIKTSFV